MKITFLRAWCPALIGSGFFPGSNARLDKMAFAGGYKKIEVAQVRDRNQLPIFEVFRIVPRGPGSPP